MKKLSEKEIFDEIKSNLKLLYDIDNDADSEEEDILNEKIDVICPFYQRGKYPDCNTCIQNIEKVDECIEQYRENINKTPVISWQPNFGVNEVTERDSDQPLNKVQSGMLCDSCYFSDNCSQYSRGSSCSIDWSDGYNESDPTRVVDHLIKMQNERLNRARLAEKLDGGVPDGNTSVEMDRLSGLLQQKQDLRMNKFSVHIEGSADSPASAGVLSTIFGGMLGGKKEEAPAEEVEDIETIEIKDESTPEQKPERKKRVRGKHSEKSS